MTMKRLATLPLASVMLTALLALPAAAEPVAYTVVAGDRIALPEDTSQVNVLRMVEIDWSAYAGRKARVAVSKVDNTSSVASYTANDNYGSSSIEWAYSTVPVNGIEAIITDAMNRSGRFRLVERQAIGNIMQEQDFGASGRVAAPSAAGMGQILGAEYLVEVVITGYDPGVNARSTNLGGVGGLLGGRLGGLGALAGNVNVNSKTSSIGLNFRLIDATTSEVVFTKQVNRELQESGLSFGGAGWGGGNAFGGFVGAYARTPIGQAVIAAINDGVYELVKQIGAKPATGSIVKVEGGRAWLNMGVGQVAVGDRLRVSRKGEALIDPETGISLGSSDTPLGEARVVEVQERFSIAQLEGGASGAQARDVVASLAPPEPIEFGPMIADLERKPRGAR